MHEPDLAGQKTGRDADKCSGHYIAEEMPITQGQQRRRNEQQSGKQQDAASIESQAHLAAVLFLLVTGGSKSVLPTIEPLAVVKAALKNCSTY